MAQTVLLYVVVAAASIIAGVIFALPAALPPFRGLARHSGLIRAFFVIGLTLLALLVVFGLTAWLTIESQYSLGANVFSGQPDPQQQAAAAREHDLTVYELWWRSVLPPGLRPACFTGDTTICARADQAAPGLAAGGAGQSAILDYAVSWVPALISAWTTLSIVRRVTRPRPRPRRDRRPDREAREER